MLALIFTTIPAIALGLTLCWGGDFPSSGSGLTDRNSISEGCVASGRIYAKDGNLYWAGCPTYTCGDYPDECQMQQSGLNRWCACLYGGSVLCKATAKMDATQSFIVNVTCKRQDCANACLVAVVPWSGPATFALCNCQ